MPEKESIISKRNNQILDPVMTSINKSLQKPIISGSVMAETDAVSTISNISNTSNISNLSTISNSSLYIVRQERRINLIDYIKQTTKEYLPEIFYHLGLTLVIAILSGIIGTTVLYGWSMMISVFLIVIYGIMISSNISAILKVWRSNTSNGIDSFWGACMILAYKNALILQEYIDVYGYVSRSDNVRRTSIDKEDKFMIDDPDFQYIHPSEIKKIIQRIHSYIILAYELSHLTQSDNLIIHGGIVYCNVSAQSLTNERNRKIEQLLNALDPNKKEDIIGSWNAIDKKISSKYHSISFIPFRWMIYEYRNLFRYMNSAPELRKIYNNVKLNFETYEQCVTDISQSLHRMRTDDSIYPDDMRNFTLRIGDILSVSADSFFGISIVTSLIGISTLWEIIIYGILNLIVGVFMHLITIIVINEVRKLISQNRFKTPSKTQMDLIYKEMQVLCC
jgi:hypothetical protein